MGPLLEQNCSQIQVRGFRTCSLEFLCIFLIFQMQQRLFCNWYMWKHTHVSARGKHLHNFNLHISSVYIHVGKCVHILTIATSAVILHFFFFRLAQIINRTTDVSHINRMWTEFINRISFKNILTCKSIHKYCLKSNATRYKHGRRFALFMLQGCSN